MSVFGTSLGGVDAGRGTLLETVMPEEKTFEERVNDCLDEILPSLQAHGGGCELVAIEGKVVKLRLQGACKGCPGAAMTMKMGIERHMKEQIPELEAVESVA